MSALDEVMKPQVLISLCLKGFWFFKSPFLIWYNLYTIPSFSPSPHHTSLAFGKPCLKTPNIQKHSNSLTLAWYLLELRQSTDSSLYLDWQNHIYWLANRGAHSEEPWLDLPTGDGFQFLLKDSEEVLRKADQFWVRSWFWSRI